VSHKEILFIGGRALKGLLNIGYGNFVNLDQLVAILSPDSAPMKREVANARRNGHLYDATQGHRTRSVLLMQTGQLILSANQPDTLAEKVKRNGPEKEDREP
jgi:regulator of extracellular matrix RemA (YlzA/DUF370 family)